MKKKRYRLALLGLLFIIPFLAALAAAPMALAQATDTPTATATATLTPTPAEFATGFSSCWDLDEESFTRYDSVGSNDLTDQNTVGSVAGINGNAAHFIKDNGESLYALETNTLDAEAGDATLVFWLRVVNTNNQEVYVSKAVYTGIYNGYYVRNHFGNLYINFGDGSTQIYFQTSSSVSTSWTHFALVFDRDDVLSIYKNGVLQGSTSLSGIGSVNPNVGFYLAPYFADIDMDQVAFWKRALSASQVAYIYNSGNGRDCQSLLDYPPPTPTLTPTPGGELRVDLTSGDWLTVNRQIDYGQIATVVVILGLLLVGIVYAIIRFGRQWL